MSGYKIRFLFSLFNFLVDSFRTTSGLIQLAAVTS